MRRELLVLQFLVHVSARHVEVPFYACVGGNGQPGICAYFESHVQPVNVSRDAFSFQEGLAACKSDALHPLFNAMRKSVLEWDETICAEYLHSFIEAELKSREIARPTRIRSAQTLIDAVNVIAARTNSLVEGSIAQHSFNDGQAIDEALKQKRTCLITAMASALPPRQDKYSRIGEIGFNVGHSAAMLLTALPRASVTSFDICSWPYTRESAKFLRSNIKNGTKRLQLVCGDSRESLAQYDPLRVGGGMEEDIKEENPSPGLFDAIFIDGGHLYVQAITDIKQSANLAKPGALIIVDDCEADRDVYEDSLRAVCPDRCAREVDGVCENIPTDPEEEKGEAHLKNLLLRGCTPFAGSVGQAWRHAVSEGIVVEMANVCGHIGLCMGHFTMQH